MNSVLVMHRYIMATHSSTLAWKIPWTEELVGYSPWDRKESDMIELLHYRHTDNMKPKYYIFYFSNFHKKIGDPF